ncbi:MAG: urea ABC transporter substrate-binding protein [Woeseiaceae bacterium]
MASAGRRRLPIWIGIGISALLLPVVVVAVIFGFGNRITPAPGPGGHSASGSKAIVPPGGEPIRVGILHSLSGTMASSETAVVDATMLAIDELNQSGGLLGRPIKPVVADGRSDWPTFAGEAERLINKEGVCTVFGCWTSASRKTVLPIFEQHDHLLIYPVQYEGIEESPSIIYTGSAPNQQIIPAVKWAYAFLEKRQFFLVGSDYVFPRTANEIVKDNLNAMGAELVGEEYLPLGSTDVKAIVEKIKVTEPDVILNTINGDSNIAFFRALREADITPASIPTISFSIGEQELLSLNVAEMEGDYAAWTYFQSIDTPENKQFVERVKAKYGPQRVVTDPMEAAYFGVKLWANAVKDAGNDKTADIRRSMRNQRMAAPGGEVRIDPGTQHTFKTTRIGRVQADGQFEIVWSAPRPEQPVPYPSSRTAEEWRAFLNDLYNGWGGQWSRPANPSGPN